MGSLHNMQENNTHSDHHARPQIPRILMKSGIKVTPQEVTPNP